MKLAKFKFDGAVRVGLVEEESLVPLDLEAAGLNSLADLLESADLDDVLGSLERQPSIPLSSAELLAPIDDQEVWAAGVTYLRSQTARMEESAAAASCYDRVYEADRPELFFKATPHRVAGPGASLRIRSDASWNVPEPEITLALNSRLEIVGFTIGNDMSSRDIEGENPLYLPQAKVYDACAGLGPWITTADSMPAREEMGVRLGITRGDEVVFFGKTSAEQMAREFWELVEWLGRDQSFPSGVFLMTGTGIVPDSSFTLEPGDVVSIEIDGIGTLSNSIIRG